ncbi:hypothetical protein BGZ61DRAFT_530209 [Ilyonectria robusta]|uniref:uncharacterized protein n=1 Tax=Ilyonectria robusta TaxID=1079257 RepID=UPI001E8E7208|nr:uncharacterized protein BGZ61DRAFT_530209 [Ilyonectria robusta]KAH8721681.1 hypothetical protein BGZ61DRAFT_530209 [Ilyonectria robusta]
MSSSKLLLKGGRLLVHDQNKRVVCRHADLLIHDDRIHEIGDHIQPAEGVVVIDCTDTIVSPGFIDTHRHQWQSQQKGLHADHHLLDYYHSGNLASSHYAPEDAFWGVLSSSLEAIDAGTTTVVDHAHVNYSPEHSKEAIRGTVASGIRGIFCYCAHPRVETWHPELKMDNNPLAEGVMDTFRELAAMQPFGPRGRVRLGFAMDVMFVRPQVLKDTFAEVRKLGAHLITSHVTRVSMMDGLPSPVTIMHENKLLGPDILLSHANHISADELSQIETSGAHLSSTPLSELQMGHGHPVCLQPEFLNLCSLGTDSCSICSSSIPRQMEIALQVTRARRSEEQLRNRKWDGTIGPSVEEVYNLGTILGAQAVGLEDDIGSLAVGKKADIVVFNGKTPAMLAAADCNPIAAIVLHSSVQDVQTVIVDGVIRKENTLLNKIVIPQDIAQKEEMVANTSESLQWDEVAREVEKSRQRLKEIRGVVDEEAARNGLIRSFIAAMKLASDH